jgi:hypothetical protein
MALNICVSGFKEKVLKVVSVLIRAHIIINGLIKEFVFLALRSSNHSNETQSDIALPAGNPCFQLFLLQDKLNQFQLKTLPYKDIINLNHRPRQSLLQ